MRQKLTIFLTALLLLAGMTSWGQLRTVASIDFSQQGYSNGQVLDSVIINIDDNVTIVFYQGEGNNKPKYYNTGSAIRVYPGNNFVVSSSGTISNIELTFGTGDGSNSITPNEGTFTATTWVGSSSDITFTIGGDTGNRRIKTVTVTYTSGGSTTTNNISDITTTGTYTIQGTIVAKGGRGFIVGDGSGYIYYYNPNYDQSLYNIGDIVNLAGPVAAYGGVFEFNNSTVVTTATTSNYVAEEPTMITGAEMDDRVASATPQLTTYVKYVGTLSISSSYYNIINIEGANTAKGSISFPLSTDFLSLNGQEVVVKGYFVGVSNSQYYNTMLGSIEANTGQEPSMSVSVTELTGFQYTYNAGPSQVLSFTVTGHDLDGNVSVAAPTNFEVALNASGPFNNNITLTPTNGALNAIPVYVRMKSGLAAGSYSGNVSLTSGSMSATVALSGSVTDQNIAETPVFSPAGGTYLTAQTVSISCGTPGASIHYTTDGSTPTENSPVYNAPLTISVTTTLKAMAVASGYANSAVAEATYTINEAITIAEARALNLNDYGCVEGTVIFIDGRNVYVQDETAGIDLYLNSNTVPTNLAIGDIVRAYGKRAAYNGLVELSGINGGNANEFTIISNNNPLPLTVKTIAEINADYNGSNMLQSTRVKILNAVIGAINPTGNTVITQNGSNLNIYRIPNVEGMTEGDLVTVTGIIGCHNAVQLRVVNASDVLFEHHPILTASPTSLSGFTYDIDEGGPSGILHFQLSGDYLSSSAHVFPSESFEISTLADDAFTPENPASIYSPGSFYNINIYVRMKAGLEVGSYNEQLYAVSEDADTLYISVSGTVTTDTPTPPDPPTPGDGNYVRISELSSLTDGAYVVFAARFDNNATDYYAMSNTSSGKPAGVMFTSATSGNDEVLPATIVDEESNYYWVVGMTNNGYTFTNANGELIGHSSSTNFATGGDNTEWSIDFGTAGDAAMVPNYSGFIITNVNNEVRHFALNSNHNFGPYHSNNLNTSGYNFYLDLFVKTEGGTPPTPTAATPVFTPAAGTYYETQTVSITCATEDATIYYSTVSANGPWMAYENALTVSESLTIWAYAEKEGYNNSNIAEASYTIQSGSGSVAIFNQDWEGGMNGWTFINVEGEATWSIAQYNNNHYAYLNGYNQGANEDWCISPAFNLDVYSNPMLSFRTAKNFNGNDLEVFFSNDYDGEDPTEATWTPLSCALSTGGYTWTESGSISLDNFSGTECYIGFKYTCTASGAAAWEVDDILLVGQTSNPVVTVTPLTLTGFNYTEGNGPSEEQDFTVSGLNLTNNIIVGEAPDYEISSGSGDNFVAQSSLTLTPTNGTLEETTVYVRLKAGLAVGNYNDEDITISCIDVDDLEVTCSGSVTAQPIPGDDYVRISDINQLVAGNHVIIATRYNNTENAYLAASNTLTSGKLTTTEFTSQMNGNDEIIPASILADEDSYYWTVDVTEDGYTFTNANGDMIGYGNSGTNLVLNGEKTVWTIESGVSAPESLVPEYFGFNIVNATTETRAMALRVTDSESVIKAYATSNMTNGEYNFFLDIFMQGEGGVPPTPTVNAPTFTPAAGTYFETLDVVISCPTEGATIYYSLDGESGPWDEYEEAVTIDENMIIWAYATKEGYNDSPVVSAEYVIMNDVTIIFNQDWEEDWHGWTQVNVEGEDTEWTIAEHSGNHYAYMNGYNHGANEDWLISPAFDLDSYDGVVLTFVTAMNYNGPDIEVFFSNDYDGTDPTAANWTSLTCELSPGSWTWTESGEISLNEFSGSNCYIAFKYISTESEAAAWEVDDIMLFSGGGTTTPTLTATPNTINGLDYMEGEGPSASQSYTLTGANLNGEGDITVTASEGFEISLDDEIFSEEQTIPYADGIITNQPVTLYVRLIEGLEVGSHEGIISHAGGDAYTEVTVSGIVHSEDEPMIEDYMPYYIQGNNGSNNNRVPVAIAAYLHNLEPNTTYRYTNQFVDANDGPETPGAGNVIYTNENGFYRSTSPSLATEGGYGEFTTDEDGLAFAWFMNEPTANARFTPGNQVYLRIRINDGHDGTTVAQTFTSYDYATVLNFGTEYDEYNGTAFYAKSNEAPMSFAMLWAFPEDNRPIYSTSIETVGVDYGSINQYADFYKELVAGKEGWFGGILPNDNKDGINAIWIVDMESDVTNEYYAQDGEWLPDANTINPSAGLDEPIFIDLTDDGVDEAVVANVKVWNTDHEFVIENGDNAHYRMTVYNVLGQPIMQHQVNAGSTERISHNMAKGVYVISLQNNQSNVSVKVIVR